MIIETERLFLREMTQNDFEALYKIFSDKEISKYYPYDFDKERVLSWIERNIKRYEEYGFGLWAVCLKETNEVIGDCGLTIQNINGEEKPEIGYHIRKDMQKKGFAKEAAKAVRNWTFENTSFDKIYSYMKYDNLPSVKTAVSYGCSFLEEYEDEANKITKVYVISREEWNKIK